MRIACRRRSSPAAWLGAFSSLEPGLRPRPVWAGVVTSASSPLRPEPAALNLWPDRRRSRRKVPGAGEWPDSPGDLWGAVCSCGGRRPVHELSSDSATLPVTDDVDLLRLTSIQCRASEGLLRATAGQKDHASRWLSGGPQLQPSVLDTRPTRAANGGRTRQALARDGVRVGRDDACSRDRGRLALGSRCGAGLRRPRDGPPWDQVASRCYLPERSALMNAGPLGVPRPVIVSYPGAVTVGWVPLGFWASKTPTRNPWRSLWLM